MAINKVQYGSTTLIDLSTDTVASAADILLGKVGHLRDGTVVTGTAAPAPQHTATITRTSSAPSTAYVSYNDVHYTTLDETFSYSAGDNLYVYLGNARSVTVYVDGVAVASDNNSSSASALVEYNYTLPDADIQIEITSSNTFTRSIRITVLNEIQELTITQNGTYTASGSIKGYSPITVTVEGGTTLIAKNITENGTYNASSDSADGYSSVTVNVSSGSPTLQTKSKTYTPSTSQQTEAISADSGYDGLQTVNVTVNAMPTGTAGTPTATKGSVSNHSVSVTPSVTNTTGYINGGTNTGTAVTVSASELVSGSETKTANGSYDVTNLATLVVAIPIVTYYTGSSTPASSLGSNGDIYVKVAS